MPIISLNICITQIVLELISHSQKTYQNLICVTPSCVQCSTVRKHILQHTKCKNILLQGKGYIQCPPVINSYEFWRIWPTVNELTHIFFISPNQVTVQRKAEEDRLQKHRLMTVSTNKHAAVLKEIESEWSGKEPSFTLVSPIIVLTPNCF